MPHPEEVVINILAEDKASTVLQNIKSNLDALQKIGNSLGGNSVLPTNTAPKITNDFNQIKEQIGTAQKALDAFGTSSNSSTPSSLNDALNQLEKIRQIAQKSIKINIDDGKVKSTSENVHQLESMISKVRENAQQSFAGSGGGFRLVGKPYSYYPPNFTMVGSSYDPTKLLGSGEGNYSNPPLAKTGELLDLSKEKALNFGKASKDAGKMSYSSFHQLNNMMLIVGNTFNDIGTKIAGVFGAAGLSGMVEKMWSGAAQRQQNMMYLMHQKGTEQANKYYDEIMDIVTQLPGDDTFLTNILNMSSAMDKSLKLDNLKEAGTAITDYYMAATMKGENSYETQKDIRKYITTGDTRGMRNSVLASELDLLKNRNNVLERTKALQDALEKTGFKGMSEYESATNELEEFKGHFQKAFADLGMIIVSVVQPLMKFYNTLDSIFGSRISQLIIVMATALVALFTTIGGGLIIASSSFRMIETITLGMEALGFALGVNIEKRGIFNTLLMMSMSLEQREKVLKGEITLATWSETVANVKNSVAKMLGIKVTEGEIVSTWTLLGATLGLAKAKLILAWNTVVLIFNVISDTIWEWRNTDARLSSIIVTKAETFAMQSNTIARIANSFIKMRGIAITLGLVAVTIVKTIHTWISTDATLKEASTHAINAVMKTADAEATVGLATATAFLEATLAPLILPLLIIVGVILAIVVAVEKLGEAFGWWKDFGSMIKAISDGIGRLWGAFVNSEPIQGIIQYFGDFFETIQSLIGSIFDLFGALFGWDNHDNGTFDLVGTIIQMFGKLGETIKWVWNVLDDFSNENPLGIILTWINPLGILLFHLDELGSFFEDVRDAIDRFKESIEFEELMDAFNEAWTALQEPFQELWEVIEEVQKMFGEVFGDGQDPVGQGTEDRINFLVEILKGLAYVIKNVVVPVARGLAMAIRISLMPIRGLLELIKLIINAFSWLSEQMKVFSVVGDGITFVINSISEGINWLVEQLKVFGAVWEMITSPIVFMKGVLDSIGNAINQVSNAIKNSVIGKLLGWDKDDNDDKDKNKPVNSTRNTLYNRVQSNIASSNMDESKKHRLLDELNRQKLGANNVNEVRNLGQTYNTANNQRQVVINQNFSEGSMPIDARNMTRKEARKMFIGAFGYRRAVGSKGILR